MTGGQCPICKMELSTVACSKEHSTLYTRFLRDRKRQQFEQQARQYRDTEMAKLAVYNEDFIGAIYEVDLSQIDWDAGNTVEQIKTMGRKLVEFDSVITE